MMEENPNKLDYATPESSKVTLAQGMFRAAAVLLFLGAGALIFLFLMAFLKGAGQE
jgi:hypothetical protein